MPFSFVLFFALASFQSQNAAVQAKPPKDALALLAEISQRYADAKSYHIEAVQERSFSNELQHSWQKMLFAAIVMPGGRYRYAGRSGYDAAIVVSDGTTEWDYHPYEHRYTRQSAPAEYPPEGSSPPQERTAEEAESEVKQMAGTAKRLKSAAFLPDESISVNGAVVECYVIHYSEEDLKKPREGLKEDDTLWIDKSRKLVLKTFTRTDSYMVIPASSSRIPLHEETTLTYSVVELDQQEPATSFAFVPPSDAKQIAKFPNPFGKQVDVQDLTGKPAPDLSLKTSEGKIATLRSFRGHPVFIEFWATWCGPCIDLMPELGILYAEIKGKDLAWMTIDNDEDSTSAAEFLSEQHIGWPNYHDEDGSLGKAFHRSGIPLAVLIDADGKIVFYQAGYEISQLRAAIAKLGPQFSLVAPLATPEK
ncbi:MAG: redoxin family protein [Candidatus Sulfotelmatobacter sp.]